MDKFLKRTRDDDGPCADDEKRQKKGRTTFLYVKPARDVVEVLSSLGSVVTFTEFKTWPKSMPSNVAKVEAAAAAAATEGPVVLVGNSFGCRIVAGVLAKRGEAWSDKAVMVSYPLYGEKPQPERAAILQGVHGGAKLLFHSGSRDEYLDRSSWRGAAAPTGVAALEAVLSESISKPEATFSVVDGAKHSACGSRAAKAQLRSALVAFLAERSEAPAAEKAEAPAVAHDWGSGQALGSGRRAEKGATEAAAIDLR